MDSTKNHSINSPSLNSTKLHPKISFLSLFKKTNPHELKDLRNSDDGSITSTNMASPIQNTTDNNQKSRNESFSTIQRNEKNRGSRTPSIISTKIIPKKKSRNSDNILKYQDIKVNLDFSDIPNIVNLEKIRKDSTISAASTSQTDELSQHPISDNISKKTSADKTLFETPSETDCQETDPDSQIIPQNTKNSSHSKMSSLGNIRTVHQTEAENALLSPLFEDYNQITRHNSLLDISKNSSITNNEQGTNIVHKPEFDTASSTSKSRFGGKLKGIKGIFDGISLRRKKHENPDDLNEGLLDLSTYSIKKNTPSSKKSKQSNNKHQSKVLHNQTPFLYSDDISSKNLTQYDSESWAPPESWSVMPIPTATNDSSLAGTFTRDLSSSPENHNEFRVIDDGKQYYLRIYKEDSSFGTFTCKLTTTVSELLNMAGKKFFIPDISLHCLYLTEANGLSRILRMQEMPAAIFKKTLTNIGYLPQDNIEALCREDNTYLCKITLVRAGITAVPFSPNDLSADSSIVNLRAKQLQTIPVPLYNCSGLIVSLNLSENLGINLPSDFLQDCLKLTELNLSVCNLYKIPTSLQYTPGLRKLDLSSNNINSIDDTLTEYFTNLEELILNNNKISSIPDNFRKLQNLEILCLSNNTIQNFPIQIADLTRLTRLDLSFNFIKTIPDEISNLQNLSVFNITGNNISGSLTGGMSKLLKLSELYLELNSIHDFSSITMLPNLVKIFSGNNKVINPKWSAFNTEFMYLNNNKLKKLVLDNNLLVGLPRSTSNLVELTYISVSNNSLSVLPKDLLELANLQYLDAHKNKIKTVYPEIWFMPKLSYLNLSSNSLEQFPHPTTLNGINRQPNVYGSVRAAAYSASSVAQKIQHHKNLNKNKLQKTDTQSDLPSSSLSFSDSQDFKVKKNSDSGINTTTSSFPFSDDIPQGNENKTNSTFQPNSENSISPSDRLGLIQLQNSTMSRPRLMSESAIQSSNSLGNCFNKKGFTSQENVLSNTFSSHLSEARDRKSLSYISDSPSSNRENMSYTTLPKIKVEDKSPGLDNKKTEQRKFSTSNLPPLSYSLKDLRLSNNYLGDDFLLLSSYLPELKVLNLSYNDLFEIPVPSMRNMNKITELFLSGTKISTIPEEESAASYEKQNVHGDAEPQKNRLAVGPFTIPKEAPEPSPDMSDFYKLKNLKTLGLLELTVMVPLPEDTPLRRVRMTDALKSVRYGISDALGSSSNSLLRDVVHSGTRSGKTELLFGIIHAQNCPNVLAGTINKYISEEFLSSLKKELNNLDKLIEEHESDLVQKNNHFIDDTNKLNSNNLKTTEVFGATDATSGSTDTKTHIKKKSNKNIFGFSTKSSSGDILEAVKKVDKKLPSSINHSMSISSIQKHHHDKFIVSAHPSISNVDLSRPNDLITGVLRRVFLETNKNLGTEMMHWNFSNMVYNQAANQPELSKRNQAITDHNQPEPNKTMVGKTLNDLYSFSEYKKANFFTGATAVFAFLQNQTLYIANAGDAVGVLSRRGTPILMSTKHVITDKEEISRIKGLSGDLFPKTQVVGNNTITRGFGSFGMLPYINSEPTIRSLQLGKEDEFIILGNSALWDYISPESAVEIARKHRRDPTLAATQLRDYAVAYGSKQAIMVMVIQFGPLFQTDNEKNLVSKSIRSSVVGKRSSNNGIISGPNLKTDVPLPKDLKSHEKSNLSFGGYSMNFNDLDSDEEWTESASHSKGRSGTRQRSRNGGVSNDILLSREIEPPVGEVALVFTDVKDSTSQWDANPAAMQEAIKIHNAMMRRFLRNFGGYEVKTEGDAFMVSFSTVTKALNWCLSVQLAFLHLNWPQEILDSEDGKPIYYPDITQKRLSGDSLNTNSNNIGFEKGDNKDGAANVFDKSNGGTKTQNDERKLIYRGLRVRMGIHLGTPVCEEDPITRRMDYFGPMVNRAARVSGAADGGQIFVSKEVAEEVIAILNLFSVATKEEVTDMRVLINDDVLAKDVQMLWNIGLEATKVGERKLKGLETPETIWSVYPSALRDRMAYEKDLAKAIEVKRIAEKISGNLHKQKTKPAIILSAQDNNIPIGGASPPKESLIETGKKLSPLKNRDFIEPKTEEFKSKGKKVTRSVTVGENYSGRKPIARISNDLQVSRISKLSPKNSKLDFLDNDNQTKQDFATKSTKSKMGSKIPFSIDTTKKSDDLNITLIRKDIMERTYPTTCPISLHSENRYKNSILKSSEDDFGRRRSKSMTLALFQDRDKSKQLGDIKDISSKKHDVGDESHYYSRMSSVLSYKPTSATMSKGDKFGITEGHKYIEDKKSKSLPNTQKRFGDVSYSEENNRHEKDNQLKMGNQKNKIDSSISFNDSLKSETENSTRYEENSFDDSFSLNIKKPYHGGPFEQKMFLEMEDELPEHIVRKLESNKFDKSDMLEFSMYNQGGRKPETRLMTSKKGYEKMKEQERLKKMNLEKSEIGLDLEKRKNSKDLDIIEKREKQLENENMLMFQNKSQNVYNIDMRDVVCLSGDSKRVLEQVLFKSENKTMKNEIDVIFDLGVINSRNFGEPRFLNLSRISAPDYNFLRENTGFIIRDMYKALELMNVLSYRCGKLSGHLIKCQKCGMRTYRKSSGNEFSEAKGKKERDMSELCIKFMRCERFNEDLSEPHPIPLNFVHNLDSLTSNEDIFDGSSYDMGYCVGLFKKFVNEIDTSSFILANIL
ncbi:hypothetical protein BB558_006049 [Smittium angustum]|uniref:Adenylate cyclase n=1 Tax=Smittium angustum TaxID=133377 RepID=A0A2U1IYR7_SMIAN|nr:hypothetical protein BB558_006049 [Smittium angustum]